MKNRLDPYAGTYRVVKNYDGIDVAAEQVARDAVGANVGALVESVMPVRLAERLAAERAFYHLAVVMEVRADARVRAVRGISRTAHERSEESEEPVVSGADLEEAARHEAAIRVTPFAEEELEMNNRFQALKRAGEADIREWRPKLLAARRATVEAEAAIIAALHTVAAAAELPAPEGEHRYDVLTLQKLSVWRSAPAPASAVCATA